MVTSPVNLDHSGAIDQEDARVKRAIARVESSPQRVSRSGDVLPNIGQDRKWKRLRSLASLAIREGGRHSDSDHLHSGGFHPVMVISQLGQPRIAVGSGLAIEEYDHQLRAAQIPLELHKLGGLIVECKSRGRLLGGSRALDLGQAILPVLGSFPEPDQVADHSCSQWQNEDAVTTQRSRHGHE